MNYSLLVCMTVAFCCPAVAAAESPETGFTLADKTLVAWGYPANLAQRGSGVISVFDSGEHFDAIVLGEKQPGKWMAGSDFFRRTEENQSRYPAETADSKTLVQVAIVYRGPEIRIYRNGRPYADYKTSSPPQPFDQQAIVLFGLRYLGAQGAVGPLAGDIEEARLYDVALEAKTIAALAPGKPSDPQPLAQWTFEDGTAADAMGTYRENRLAGGAKIVDGRLRLDGRSGYMVAMTRKPADVVQTMFYTPAAPASGLIWDTWLYRHADTYYLFYLAGSMGRWTHFGLATSPDGVHWKEHGPILHCGPGVKWMGTGHVWKSPDFDVSGKFIINYSEWHLADNRQDIMFATSTDLIHWTKVDERLRFRQDTRWYRPKGRWDCIDVTPDPGTGGYFGYWTADPDPAKVDHPAGFGFGQSADGITWRALEPVVSDSRGEVGGIQRIGDVVYLMLSEGRISSAGKPEGPFVAQKINHNVLGGDTYFPRFFPDDAGHVLLNHHMTRGPVYFAPLKAVQIDSHGILRLVWWPGNEKMKHAPVEVNMARSDGDGGKTMITMLENRFDTDEGIILEGTVGLPGNATSGPTGIYLEQADGQGTAVLLSGENSPLGKIRVDGTGLTVAHTVDRGVTFGPEVRFRLLLKKGMMEFYADDYLLHVRRVGSNGRIGLIGDKGKQFKNLQAWSAAPE